MKYAVHVKTQEEQDYVSMKLYNDIYENRWNYVTNDNDVFDVFESVINDGYEIISFDEFKLRYEPQLKVGDTFEYNGFICRVEGEIEKWVYNTKTNAYYKTLQKKEHLKEITNKEFIKQLEENALS